MTQSEIANTEENDLGVESRPDPVEWARSAEAGDYLIEYDESGVDAEDDDGARCGYSDEELDQAGRVLAERDLRLVADDVGLIAEKVR